MASDNRYSRFVGFAKIVFPLLALGFLSTIFLFSRTLDPSAAIPFSDIDIEKIAKEQLLSSPKFSGVTSDGSAISVTAKSARPDLLNPRRLSATQVMALITTLSDDVYEITADKAQFDGNNDDLSLNGNVEITSSSGYSLRTENLTANLETTGFLAETEVEGTAPSGSITAGRMELLVKDGSQVLIFTNGVKLIYVP